MGNSMKKRCCLKAGSLLHLFGHEVCQSQATRGPCKNGYHGTKLALFTGINKHLQPLACWVLVKRGLDSASVSAGSQLKLWSSASALTYQVSVPRGRGALEAPLTHLPR